MCLGAAAAGRLVGNETDDLDLADVVESDDADVSVGVSFLGFINLLDHLRRVGAPEHGELPHGPVAAIVVPRGGVVLTVHPSFLYTYNTCNNKCILAHVLSLD